MTGDYDDYDDNDDLGRARESHQRTKKTDQQVCLNMFCANCKSVD